MGKAGKKLKKQLKKLQESLHTGSELPCLACSAHEHILCSRPDIEEQLCCCTAVAANNSAESDIDGDESGSGKPNKKADRIGAMKGADEITDVQSTGRKRAAVLYPIEEGMVCEWANLKAAGGGVVPIIGCLGNPATDRHHGPDKNTLNNKEGNVHRICSYCHNYWHAKNDEFYGKRPQGTEPFIPLDGHEWCAHDNETTATLEEVVAAQILPGRKQPKKASALL